MNSTVDRMLGLTADIAEELLLVKDAGCDSLPDGLKLKIISLAELAATTDAPGPAGHIPSTTPSAGVSAEITEGAQAMEAEESMEAEAISETETAAQPSVVTEPEVEAPVESDLDVAPHADPPHEDATPRESTHEEWANEEAPRENTEGSCIAVRHVDPKALFQAFSINDAFLFRREIFGGSKERFFDSLDHIATLPDREALQQYLAGNLGLDLDQYPGKDFYKAIAVFF